MRYNLWLTVQDYSKVVCYGDQSEMDDIARLAPRLKELGRVQILPDGEEPDTLSVVP